MVNGLPGNVAQIVARHIFMDPRFELLPYSMTGPEIRESEHRIETLSLELVLPDAKAAKIETIRKQQGPFFKCRLHPSVSGQSQRRILLSGRPAFCNGHNRRGPPKTC